MIELYGLDALEWLKEFEGGTVDLTVTDPAYPSLEKHRKKGTTTRLKQSKASSNEWFPVVPNAYLHLLMHELYRVHRNNTHCYVMCDEATLFKLVPYAEEAGWTFWKSIIWDKQRMGMGYHYRNETERVAFFEKGEREERLYFEPGEQGERIAFFEKGKRKLNNLGIPDILRCPAVRDGYPTEKPVSLLEVLVLNSSESGELVIDPFMGSASTMVAAFNNNRAFRGTDINPEPARQRYREVVAASPH